MLAIFVSERFYKTGWRQTGQPVQPATGQASAIHAAWAIHEIPSATTQTYIRPASLECMPSCNATAQSLFKR